MKTKIILTLLLFLNLNILFAQGGFKVIIAQNSDRKDLKGNTSKLVADSIVKSGEIIIVKDTGYVGLIHRNGKAVELKTKGIYKVDSLEKTCAVACPLSLYLSGYLSAAENIKPVRNAMRVTGSVERGYDLPIYATKINKVYQDRVILKWKQDRSGCYNIFLLNMFDEEVLKVKACGTSAVLDLREIDATQLEDDAVKITISDTANQRHMLNGESYFLVFLKKDKNQNITDSLSILKKENPENTALNLVFAALLYEDKELFLNAMLMCQEALLLAPEVPAIQYKYDAFLRRNGLMPYGY